MATITYRLSNLMESTFLQLGDETWARKLPFGANWSRLRFGILFTYGNASSRAANVVDVAPMIGIGSSVPYPPGHYGCTNMVGVCPSGDPTPGSWNTFTYTATAYGGWQSSGVNPRFFTRQFDPQLGPTWSVVAASSAAVAYAPDPSVTSIIPNPKRNGMLIFEIGRGMGGAGTAFVQLFYQVIANTQAGYWFTEADLMDAVSTQGTSLTIQGLAFTTTSAQSIAVSDICGPLDTLFVSNNKAAFPLNIQAMGCCIIMEASVPLLGGANDSFSNYGTQNFPAYTTTGSLVLGDWYGTGGQTAWTLFGTGWYGNPMTAQSLAGTVTAIPYDPFTQYTVSSTQITTEISAGTNWSSIGYFSGTATNTAPCIGLAGTSIQCPVDLMVQYVVTSGTFNDSTTLNAGTGWAQPAVVTGTAAPERAQIGLAGTSVRCPVDLMVEYIVTGGTFSGGMILTAGTGWASYGTVSGTAAPEGVCVGLVGTSSKCPFDLLVQYEPGAVTSGVTIAAGTGWEGPGIVR